MIFTSGKLGIRDIAKLAGVSVATVSRVMNSPELTSDETRRKVEAVIKSNNYTPNLLATSLFSKRSNAIALFILDIENPFYVALIKYLNAIALESKYTLLVCNTENDPELEKKYLEYCDSMRITGIIVTEGYSNTVHFKSLSERKIAFLERKSKTHCVVSSDNDKAIRLLVDYFYNLNHRKIAFVGFDENISSMLNRKIAYTKYLEAKGLEIDEKYIFSGKFSTATGANAVDYFCSLSEKPSAVICANDQIARGFILRCNKIGLSIPNDFSVAGIDGYNNEYFHLDLTTIKQDIKRIAQLLFDCVTNDEDIVCDTVVDVSLSIGDTCKSI